MSASPDTPPHRSFGQDKEGEVSLFTLRGDNGFAVDVCDYGATMVAIRTPDRDGHVGDILLGFDSIDGYLGEHPFFGGIIGRFANRIANASALIDGKRVALTANTPPHHLHGGARGFDRRRWKVEPTAQTPATLRLSLVSPHLDEGYPGELAVAVTYRVQGMTLTISYEATTTQPTIVNLTSHGYFNLSHGGREGMRDHLLQIAADRFVAIDGDGIPTGELASVEGTPLDLRSPKRIGDCLDSNHPQIAAGRGFNHCLVLADAMRREPAFAARAHSPETGRTLELLTTEPGVQLYSGGYMTPLRGKAGAMYDREAAFCLETQHFPDSPNHSNFPSTLLRPGETFRSATVHRFSVEA